MLADLLSESYAADLKESWENERTAMPVKEKHDFSGTEFLVDQFGYRTAPSRLGLSGQVNYTERNLIEKWFHPLKMRIDRFHNSWVGSQSSVREWLEQFMHYYNHHRPHQALDGKTPIEEVQN